MILATYIEIASIKTHRHAPDEIIPVQKPAQEPCFLYMKSQNCTKHILDLFHQMLFMHLTSNPYLTPPFFAYENSRQLYEQE